MISVPCLWRDTDLARGLALLAGEAGFGVGKPSHEPTPKPQERKELRPWMESIAESEGLELEWITSTYGELDDLVERCGPALLCLHPRDPSTQTEIDPPRWILLTEPASGIFQRRLRALGPDGRIHSVDPAELTETLRAPLDEQFEEATEELLERAEIPANRRKIATAQLLSERLGEVKIPVGYLMRPGPGGDFIARLRRQGIGRRLVALVAAHAVQYALFLVSWWLIGRAALTGTLAVGWLAAWILLLMGLVPLRMATAWIMGTVSIRVGAELKRRLLHGALSLDRDANRSEGAGAALGRVIESEAVESLAVGGGLLTVTALVELPFALWVLSRGDLGAWLPLVFAVCLGVAAWVTAHYHRSLAVWTVKRLAMTHGLVEKMAGHQTRLAQEDGRRLHRGEDLELKDYLTHLGALDRALIRLLLLPRVWMLVGLAVPAASLAAGGAEGASLAVSVGGLLLTQGILVSLTSGVTSLGAAWISWSQVEPLFKSGAGQKDGGLPQLRLELRPGSESSDDRAVIRAKGLSFHYPGRLRRVLSDGELTVKEGDRILVEGPSGGGKSTLASLLAGLRRPTDGTLTLYGLDLASVGSANWRQRVVLVPQFHDNHVLTETFAFNLLMGRGWPAAKEDLREAAQVCRELGLGQLLQQMPGGLQQMVGETGWQLSHGERSRLFLARALLQDADLVIFDESFAALDPENLQLAMDCARKRGKTVVVIAHP